VVDQGRNLEPCLPSPADKPPFGSKWIHQIKTMVLGSWRGAIPWASGSSRAGEMTGRPLPLVVKAVNHLKVRSCLIDGEMVCCGESGCDDQHKSALLPTFGVRWVRLSEQIFRIDKWSVCRG